MSSYVLALAAALAAQTGSLQSASQAFDDAQLHHDRAVIDAFLAKDFQYVTRQGKLLDRDAFIAATTAADEALEPFIVSDHRLLALGTDGGIASADVIVKGTKGGKSFSDRFRFVDVYARRDGKWVVVYTQVTSPPA